MKKINFIATVVVAFLAVSANAQSVEKNVSTSDFKACKEYLTTHPTDTIRSEESLIVSTELVERAKKAGQSFNLGDTVSCVVKVFKTADGKIARNVSYKKVVGTVSLAEKTRTSRPDLKVVNVVKAENRRGVVTAKKDTVWYDVTSSNKVSFDDKVAVNRGEKRAIDKHTTLDGKSIHRVYASVLGGALLTNKGDFHPVVGGRLGYETCHFLFELEGVFSQQKHTDVAEATGSYNTFAGYLTAGWKLWQNSLYRSYVAVGASGGYAYQKTDAEDAEVCSYNYGLAGKAFVRGLWGLNRNFGLVFEGGYNLLPWVEHYGGDQKWNHGGAYLEAGVNYRF